MIYFAALRDLVGEAEERLPLLTERPLLSDVLAQVRAQHPDLPLEAVRVALNEEFSELSVPVAPGDVIALVPPVSGG